MSDQMKNKLFALQTLALWVLVLFVVGWLVFKPDNSVSKDTIDKLTVAVERISVASEKMTAVANAQREWAADLRAAATENNINRDKEYADLYEKYGYDPQATTDNVHDFYNLQLQRTKDIGSGDIRGDENPASKAGTLQEPVGKSQK